MLVLWSPSIRCLAALFTLDRGLYFCIFDDPPHFGLSDIGIGGILADLNDEFELRDIVALSKLSGLTMFGSEYRVSGILTFMSSKLL